MARAVSAQPPILRGCAKIVYDVLTDGSSRMGPTASIARNRTSYPGLRVICLVHRGPLRKPSLEVVRESAPREHRSSSTWCGKAIPMNPPKPCNAEGLRKTGAGESARTGAFKQPRAAHILRHSWVVGSWVGARFSLTCLRRARRTPKREEPSLLSGGASVGDAALPAPPGQAAAAWACHRKQGGVSVHLVDAGAM